MLPAPISSNSWDLRGQRPSHRDVSRFSLWLRAEPEHCERHWSRSLGKANMATRDGIIGDALGQPCLSDMACWFRNCPPAGGGGQSKRPAGMWLRGRTAFGVMSTYPDLPCSKANSDSGTSSKGLPVRPDPYGQCHSRQDAAWMDGGRMVRTPTKGARWKPWVPSISHMETRRRRVRSRGEPASATTGLEPEPTASGSKEPPSSEMVTSPTNLTSKKARVSRGAGSADVTSKIANMAALPKRAARSIATR